MSTSRMITRPDAGFTLVEVLVALVILSVGMLGLEALGIGASRMVNRGERISAYTEVATDRVERALSRIRQGQTPTNGSELVRTDTVQTTVTSTAAGSKTLWTVAVTVKPGTGSHGLTRADSVRVVGRVVR